MPQNINVKNEDTWARQLEYFRTHLDVAVEVLFAPITLNFYERIVLREIGNNSEQQVYMSRGAGKSYTAALGAAALCVLYPGYKVLCFAPTAAQSNVVLMKLKDIAASNSNVAKELVAYGKNLVSVSRTGGSCRFKNGSTIESMAMNSARGRRAKLVIVDEIADVDLAELMSVVNPCANFKRDCAISLGIDDVPSKLVNLTSCFPKSNQHYTEVERIIREIKGGRKDGGIICLAHTAAEFAGLTSPDFFAKEKRRMPEQLFQQEYGSIFVGQSGESAFPFELIQKCRILTDVETQQPKNSKSRYVLSIDLANGEQAHNDNTIISVVKFTEGTDEFFRSSLVYMKSFHTSKQEEIAEHVKMLVNIKFPNIERIQYDARGLGQTMPRFFIKPWNFGGKEYSPLILDTESSAGGGRKLLHAINANNADNIRFYNNMRLVLEQERLALPVSSSYIKQRIAEMEFETEDDEEKKTNLSFEEKAILFEADALQLEMNGVHQVKTPSGGITYDCKQGSHKDRYSSVAMAIDYILSEEEKAIRKNNSYCGAIIDDEDDFKSSWGNFNSFRHY